MGDLPYHRFTPARPFDYTGVDFAAPFDVKRGHTRKPVLVKTYACLFVCMSTKAVHIDCTEDLSTASFILCFECFINRRGFPQHVYSDNGSNFIGAARTLGTPTQLPYDLQDFTAKTADLQAHGVSWHFIPARSPHCGGISESGIRRMKEDLRKTLHHFTPTAAELHYLLITTEAVLNSRPLLPISLEEADGAQVITPGHFLIGRPIRAHPQDIPLPKDGLKKLRWSLLRAETEQLWKKWHTAYVQSLQSRQKWTRPQPKISVGDIVLLKDDSLKLHSWPLAKVTDVSPGPDGVVRVVTLTLPGGRTFTRHVRHLVPLMRASDYSPAPGGRMSKIQGMDLEITTAAVQRGHSRGHSRPEKITALPSNRTVNTSIELTPSYYAITCYHAIKGALFLPELRLHSLALPAFIAIVSSEDKELTLYKSS